MEGDQGNNLYQMIMLATYQLFNVMFSFEFHTDTFFVYLHTFCL